MTREERLAIHRSIQEILRQAVDLNGRDTERDLFNQPGRYVRILDSRKVSQPCQECGTPIVKESFLGGAVYFCPSCQS